MARSPVKTTTTAVVWLRRDLRIADHPALAWALEHSQRVVPLFIWAPQEEGEWPTGAAARWWLHHALEALQTDLAGLGLQLVLREGPSLQALEAVCQESSATLVTWSRCYEPAARSRDLAVETALTAQGITTQQFNSALLYEPWTVSTKAGRPFKVYTAFWKACMRAGTPEQPLPTPKPRAKAALKKLASLPLATFQLLPTIPWDQGLRQTWQPGTAGAEQRLQQFIRQAQASYQQQRNFPGVEGVARLSPYLHWGELSPRQVWWAICQHNLAGTDDMTFLGQLGWREFAHHLLYHFPHMTAEPLRPAFANFPWQADITPLPAWQHGQTGYPIVDAGMRQLWRTGWMHNRVRMIVGSFLVKDLLIHWLIGARWFWDTLVDADLANNTLGWQWIGGCGVDASPYFRIFNPILQGLKFDPEGSYVRQWVPELAHLPTTWLHRPWQAPAEVLRRAGVSLGKDYPYPIVDHSTAREQALAALAQSKRRL